MKNLQVTAMSNWHILGQNVRELCEKCYQEKSRLQYT